MHQPTSLFQPLAHAATGTARAVDQNWRPGPLAPVIWPNEVHIWRARLDAPWSWTLDEALSLDDRARADRFRFESDRRRFCVARASLRTVLGRYLKTKPGRLEFDSTEYGKPFFPDARAAQGLRFNLSHSHELALIAIGRDREVGVDVEYIRPDFATDEVANHFFSPSEVEQFRRVAAELKTQSFFNCWTRKEAYIKARGEGLYCPLDQFDVSVSPAEPAMLLDSRIDPDEVRRWSFHDLTVAPGYAATLAVENRPSRLILWDLRL